MQRVCTILSHETYVAFGFVYPIGMVLGLVKSRWHVPVQTLGSLLFVLGFFLAHAHSGRNYVSYLLPFSFEGFGQLTHPQWYAGTTQCPS